uniref:Mic1 domain-containing protein n=1 Tax=Acrobeloides nanus TaxID=290746 RepID=A0A914EM70_9BILA
MVVKQNNATVVNYLPDFIVEVLVETEQYNRLKQLLQYRVIEDSRFLAIKLIELGEAHPPLLQLAIDILARRGNFDHIIEVLLSKGKVIEAMRCINNQNIDKTSALKFLEVAWASNNRQIKYTVFTFMKEKYPKIFDNPTLQIEKYVKEFKTLFDNEEIEEAEHRFRLAKISTSPIPIVRSIELESSIPIPTMSSLVQDQVGSLPKNFRIGS